MSRIYQLLHPDGPGQLRAVLNFYSHYMPLLSTDTYVPNNFIILKKIFKEVPSKYVHGCRKRSNWSHFDGLLIELSISKSPYCPKHMTSVTHLDLIFSSSQLCIIDSKCNPTFPMYTCGNYFSDAHFFTLAHLNWISFVIKFSLSD